jgi:hypothetical protein
VLTTDQMCALGFDSIITARHRLGVLVSLGMLRRFRPRREAGSSPWHYLLGPVGAALLGAEDRDDRRWVPQVRADRQLPRLSSPRSPPRRIRRRRLMIAACPAATGDLGRLPMTSSFSPARRAAHLIGGRNISCRPAAKQWLPL